MKTIDIAIWEPGKSSEALTTKDAYASDAIKQIDITAEQNGHPYGFWVLVDRRPPICGTAKGLDELLALGNGICKMMEVDGFYPVCSDSVAEEIRKLMSTNITLH